MKARKGARPVPGPTMTIGVAGSVGRRKSGFFETYTGTVMPTCHVHNMLVRRHYDCHVCTGCVRANVVQCSAGP